MAWLASILAMVLMVGQVAFAAQHIEGFDEDSGCESILDSAKVLKARLIKSNQIDKYLFKSLSGASHRQEVALTAAYLAKQGVIDADTYRSLNIYAGMNVQVSSVDQIVALAMVVNEQAEPHRILKKLIQEMGSGGRLNSMYILFERVLGIKANFDLWQEAKVKAAVRYWYVVEALMSGEMKADEEVVQKLLDAKADAVEAKTIGVLSASTWPGVDTPLIHGRTYVDLSIYAGQNLQTGSAGKTELLAMASVVEMQADPDQTLEKLKFEMKQGGRLSSLYVLHNRVLKLQPGRYNEWREKVLADANTLYNLVSGLVPPSSN